jgi:hypothetical protein
MVGSAELMNASNPGRVPTDRLSVGKPVRRTVLNVLEVCESRMIGPIVFQLSYRPAWMVCRKVHDAPGWRLDLCDTSVYIRSCVALESDSCWMGNRPIRVSNASLSFLLILAFKNSTSMRVFPMHARVRGSAMPFYTAAVVSRYLAQIEQGIFPFSVVEG